MATGYNILQPNGRVKKVKASSMEEREKIVQDMLDEWQWYCEKNWVSPSASNPYAPENKVKSFLSSLSYFLIMGNADDIVTDYKQIMNGKREIPVSSCPSFVEDSIYSGVHVNTNELLKKAEQECFDGMMDRADKKAERRYGKPKKQVKERGVSRSERLRSILSRGEKIFGSIVDTENEFEFRDTRYRISKSMCPQYGAKKTRSGNLYDMDRIYVSTDADGSILGFYDGNLEPIEKSAVTKIS